MNKKILVFLVILGVLALSSKGVLAIETGPAALIGNSGSLYVNKIDSPVMDVLANVLLPKTTIDIPNILGKPAIKEITVDNCIADGDKIATLKITSKISYDDLIYDIMGSAIKKVTSNNSVKSIGGKDCADTPDANSDSIHLFKCSFNIDDEIYLDDKIIIDIMYTHKQLDGIMRVTKELNVGNIKGCSDPSQFDEFLGSIDAEAPDNWDDSAVAAPPPVSTATSGTIDDANPSSDDAAGVLDPNSLDAPVEDDGGCSLVATSTNASALPLILSLLPAALVALRRKF